MFLPDLVVRSLRTVLANIVRPAAIHIRRGKIAGVMAFDDVPQGCPVDDAGDAVVMPGVVDTHVHVSRPRRTPREAFAIATRAAAAGGVTTIVDIAAPATAAALIERQIAAAGNCFVDVGFWGGLVPGNVADLEPLLAAGVRGFRCSLAPSTVEPFPAVTEAELRAAMPLLAKIGSQLLVHAEVPGAVEGPAQTSGPRARWFSRVTQSLFASRKYSTYLAARPKEAETEGIRVAIDLCREYRVRTHILHLSSADALTPLYHARAAGLPISVETCPHYLTVVAEEIPDGAAAFRCDPPIRERANREYLWASLAGGLIQMIVSDHPHVSTVDRTLAATWAEADARHYALTQLVAWMCRAPARLAGLDRKGSIDVGFDADLTVWSPEANLVERTYLRGTRIYQRGTPLGTPAGHLLA